MTRRIVQIELSPPTDGSAEGLYALCEDSSIHYGWWTTGVFEWRDTLPPIDPDIPQDEPAVDPIAEIEERGAVLRIDWDTSRIVWAMDSDGMREPIATHMSDGSARLVHLRAAAARLLERIRGAK